MAEYTKLKVDELQTILKERGLAHTGKKAELIKRLEDHDASNKGAVNGSAARAEDEIDWDDDTANAKATATSTTTTTPSATNPKPTSADATTKPAAAAIAAGGTTQPPNPTAVPNQVPAQDPSQSHDLSIKSQPSSTGASGSASATTMQPTNPNASTVPPATLADEIAKRKARHAKFGTDASSDQRLKALERAAKFGGTVPPSSADSTAETANDEKMLGKLNSSLDDLAATASAKGGDRRGKRARGQGPNGSVANGGGAANSSGSLAPDAKKQKIEGKTNGAAAAAGRTGSWMSEEDRTKAAARKARFGGSAAAA